MKKIEIQKITPFSIFIKIDDVSVKGEHFHKGYFSNIYEFEYRNKKYLLKKIAANNNWPFTKKEIFSRETHGLMRLEKASSKKVLTPKIITKNNKKYFYVMEKFDVRSFYSSLLVNHNILFKKDWIEGMFYEFGIFLRKLHENNRVNDSTTHCHGDLNANNIKFSETNLIIFDPSLFKFQYLNSPKLDIFRFLMNLFPYNPFIGILLGNRKKLISSFLLGYNKSQRNPLKIDELITFIRENKKIKMRSINSGILPMLKSKYVKYANLIIGGVLEKQLRNISI